MPPYTLRIYGLRRVPGNHCKITALDAPKVGIILAIRTLGKSIMSVFLRATRAAAEVNVIFIQESVEHHHHH